jgi:hypothetical protein
LFATYYLTLKFDVSKDKKLIVQTNKHEIKLSNKQVFETSNDAFYANEKDRRLDKIISSNFLMN